MKKTPPDTCEAMGFEDYAALWGCDPCYDHLPNHYGDGYKFYNFAVEGHDKHFLEGFLPAINRTLAGFDNRRRHDKEQLLELRTEVSRRLSKMTQKSGVVRKRVQEIVDQLEVLIDLQNDYENEPRPPNEHPNQVVGNCLRAAKARLKECLEDCLS